MSTTHVCTDLGSLVEAVGKAGRGDTIITLFPVGVGRPVLGWHASSGKWHVGSWSLTQPCGAWTVDAHGVARCRVPAET